MEVSTSRRALGAKVYMLGVIQGPRVDFWDKWEKPLSRGKVHKKERTALSHEDQ